MSHIVVPKIPVYDSQIRLLNHSTHFFKIQKLGNNILILIAGVVVHAESWSVGWLNVLCG